MVKTLVVGDTEDTRSVLCQMVEQVGARVVGHVATGEEALAWLDHHPIDLVLVDFQMPGMLGDELVSRVRARWPNARTAMISVLADAAIEAKAQPSGVEWLLAKPVTVTQRERIVRSAVGHGSRLSAGRPR